LIAAIDIEDVAIGEPGNLIIPAENLIFRRAGLRQQCFLGVVVMRGARAGVIGKHKIARGSLQAFVDR
jgi:hypothetical protein